MHLYICSDICFCAFVILFILFIIIVFIFIVQGDAADHLQTDGNSSEADQKVANWLPPHADFILIQTCMFIYSYEICQKDINKVLEYGHNDGRGKLCQRPIDVESKLNSLYVKN